METYEEVELDAITLTDENGEDHDYAIVLVFPVNDISYAALCPILDGDIVDMDDVTFYRFEEDDEEVSLDDIESEEEAETVSVRRRDDGENQDLGTISFDELVAYLEKEEKAY